MALLAAASGEPWTLRSRPLRLAVLALLVAATYPLALLGHFAVDLFAGDRQVFRELQYGYSRLLAARLVNGWILSAIAVVPLWLVLHATDRYLPAAYHWIAFAAVAAAAALALVTPLPPLFAWLVLAAVVLRAVYRLSARRVVVPQP